MVLQKTINILEIIRILSLPVSEIFEKIGETTLLRVFLPIFYINTGLI